MTFKRLVFCAVLIAQESGVWQLALSRCQMI
jgi:hypothetical protein